MANIPLQNCRSIVSRALGAELSEDVFRRLQSGESMATILKGESFSPILAMSSRSLVETDDQTFTQTVEVLIPVLLEEQRVMAKRLSVFFYASGIALTVGIVLMVAFGLIFPILSATASLP